MDEETRIKSMEENLRKLQSIVQQHSAAIEQWVSSSNSGLEETRRQLGDQSRQMSDLQSKIEENRVRTEELHKGSNDNMENYHKNTEQRLENLSEMMRNLSRDREQESPLQENGANPGISGPRSTQKATELPQFPIPDRRMPGSSTNLEHSGNHSKDFHRDFIDRSMSSRGDSVTKVDGDRQLLCGSSMEDSCPSKSEDELSEIDATIDTSNHEILPGRFVHVEKQLLMNAHHMLDEMPNGKVEAFQHSKVIFVPLVISKMGCGDSEMVYDDNGAVFAHSIDLIRSRADDGEPNSTDSLGLFVFDPGKINGFPLHNGRMEAFIIVVFNPGIACTVEVEATVSVAIWWWLLLVCRNC